MKTLRSAACLLVLAGSMQAQPGLAFDVNTGKAPTEVVIPNVIPVIYGSVSPTAGDAPLVLRITTLVTNSWFDAIAPYHPTAVGAYSNLPRQAPEAATDANRNVAIIYASYRVLNSLLPQHKATWDAMLIGAGLDPDDDSQDPNTPIGIGNLAGMAVAAARERDGMNQLGDEGGRTYNRQPYADYTGYAPVNSAYELRNPSRWQPAIVTSGSGIFRVQQFVTPQLRKTEPYSYDNPQVFQTPVPFASNASHRQAYRAQADEVLAVSANLTDLQKMTAELFDDKLRSLGFSALFASQTRGLSLEQLVQYDFVTNMAAFDTAIAIWNEKHRYDAVRPFSAIRYLYGDRPVTAWGGPGMGTVDELPASQWTSYLKVADHPEYPSASASFCAAHAEASRLYLGDDDLGWAIPVAAGTSLVEPGVTPQAPLAIEFPTWTQFERDCGQSRLWGGVHFQASITAGQAVGNEIGGLAYDYMMQLLSGVSE
ncbi:hypothetical protein GCM10011348_41880 [Marinobacterium nitratireducens]|uniref:Phosphatidic acid phosphatase type 2/haloperoxidase domain-containing protein n=1 Tax=Marinobacterium nitratireducens TaxID=518897 RepID=A0A917ZQK2_9GAMM|nr:vanadium-dependent haloperoxidase [Marinobacterium nitratireducens]GGO87819.1 hypothetical protein GCM10011348_41880 [Marinobacterium nitratireducens]